MTQKTETYPKQQSFSNLHAPTLLQQLTGLLLSYPANVHDQLSTRVTSLSNHPAQKNNIRIGTLDILSDEDSVMLKYSETANDENEVRKHKFQVSGLGDQIYSRSIADCHGGHVKHAIDLRTGLDIVKHPEAVRQLSFITPLLMASTVAILGTTYLAEMGRILQR